MDRQLAVVEDTDPDRIYVENVRAFFKLPSPAARLLCETAVREGVFERRIGLLCPVEEHIVASFESEEDLPDRLSCHVCEAEGREETSHAADEMEHLTFYRLLNRAD